MKRAKTTQRDKAFSAVVSKAAVNMREGFFGYDTIESSAKLAFSSNGYEPEVIDFLDELEDAADTRSVRFVQDVIRELKTRI